MIVIMNLNANVSTSADMLMAAPKIALRVRLLGLFLLGMTSLLIACSEYPATNPFDPDAFGGGDPFTLRAQPDSGRILLHWTPPPIQRPHGFRLYRAMGENGDFALHAEWPAEFVGQNISGSRSGFYPGSHNLYIDTLDTSEMAHSFRYRLSLYVDGRESRPSRSVTARALLSSSVPTSRDTFHVALPALPEPWLLPASATYLDPGPIAVEGPYLFAIERDWFRFPRLEALNRLTGLRVGHVALGVACPEPAQLVTHQDAAWISCPNQRVLLRVVGLLGPQPRLEVYPMPFRPFGMQPRASELWIAGLGGSDSGYVGALVPSVASVPDSSVAPAYLLGSVQSLPHFAGDISDDLHSGPGIWVEGDSAFVSNAGPVLGRVFQVFRISSAEPSQSASPLEIHDSQSHRVVDLSRPRPGRLVLAGGNLWVSHRMPGGGGALSILSPRLETLPIASTSGDVMSSSASILAAPAGSYDLSGSNGSSSGSSNGAQGRENLFTGILPLAALEGGNEAKPRHRILLTEPSLGILLGRLELPGAAVDLQVSPDGQSLYAVVPGRGILAFEGRKVQE